MRGGKAELFDDRENLLDKRGDAFARFSGLSASVGERCSNVSLSISCQIYPSNWRYRRFTSQLPGRRKPAPLSDNRLIGRDRKRVAVKAHLSDGQPAGSERRSKPIDSIRVG